jgi:uncharacterized protein (TIGR02271 family)
MTMDTAAKPAFVYTRGGERGTLAPSSLPFDPGSRAVVRFETGDHLLIPVNFLHRREDGSYLLPLLLAEARRLWPFEGEEEAGRDAERVIPVLEERPVFSTRKVETARVRITKRVGSHEEDVDEPVVEETVEVERVPLNLPVDRPAPVRYEGDTLVLPVYEERLVVEKRLFLKEELRITKRRAERHFPRRATLRHEDVSVERIPAREPQPERDEPDNPR